PGPTACVPSSVRAMPPLPASTNTSISIAILIEQRDSVALRSHLIGDQTQRTHAGDGLDAVLDAQFQEDIGQMALDRLNRDRERLRNVLIRGPLDKGLEHIHLTSTQRLQQ